MKTTTSDHNEGWASNVYTLQEGIGAILNKLYGNIALLGPSILKLGDKATYHLRDHSMYNGGFDASKLDWHLPLEMKKGEDLDDDYSTTAKAAAIKKHAIVSVDLHLSPAIVINRTLKVGIYNEVFDFTKMPNSATPTLEIGGGVIKGSGNVVNLKYNGIGIEGGEHDSTIDQGEQIQIVFENARRDVKICLSSAGGDEDGDGVLREGIINATDADGVNLGAKEYGATSWSGWVDVSKMYGETSITTITLTIQERIRMTQLVYN